MNADHFNFPNFVYKIVNTCISRLQRFLYIIRPASFDQFMVNYKHFVQLLQPIYVLVSPGLYIWYMCSQSFNTLIAIWISVGFLLVLLNSRIIDLISGITLLILPILIPCYMFGKLVGSMISVPLYLILYKIVTHFGKIRIKDD